MAWSQCPDSFFFRLFFGVVFGVLAGFGVVGFSSSFSLFLGVLGAAWPASCSLPDSLSSPLFFFLQLRHWNHPWPLSLGQRLVLQACFSLALISSCCSSYFFLRCCFFLGFWGACDLCPQFSPDPPSQVLHLWCLALPALMLCALLCPNHLGGDVLHLNCLLSACFLCW